MNITRPLRPTLSSSSSINLHTPRHHPPQCLHHKPQVRHATLIKRKRRPYEFTQLVTLSDGSSFTHRTTSPTPVLVSAKDSRNQPLWNPSNKKFVNVELDDAGKLAQFRTKFGTGFDAGNRDLEKKKVKQSSAVEAALKSGAAMTERPKAEEIRKEDNFMDLISGMGLEAQAVETAAKEKRMKEEALRAAARAAEIAKEKSEKAGKGGK